MADQWIQFDDDEVEVIDYKEKVRTKKDDGKEDTVNAAEYSVKVMTGEDINDSTSQIRLRRAALPRGTFESKNAYILSYRRRDTVISSTIAVHKTPMPPSCRRLVASENQLIKTEMSTIEARYFQKIAKFSKTNNEFLSLYERLSPDQVDSSFVWIPSKWLDSWFDHRARKDAATPAIDMEPYICPHTRLDPEAVCDCKRVKTAVADILIGMYGLHGTKLTGPEAMCKECVQDVFEAAKQKDILARDQDAVRQHLKQIRLGQNSEPLTHVIASDDVDIWLKLSMRRSHFPTLFNGGASCEHGNRKLTSQDGSRDVKLVTAACWDILRRQYAQVFEW